MGGFQILNPLLGQTVVKSKTVQTGLTMSNITLKPPPKHYKAERACKDFQASKNHLKEF